MRSSREAHTRSAGEELGISEVPVDNKIDYLLRLELPFFIGVVRQSPPAMSIYSAELLPVISS